jgi:arginine utilization regulatory protein
LTQKRFNNDNHSYVLICLEEGTLQNNPQLKLHCLEEIVNKISDGIIISDSENKIALYNQSQEKLEGLSSREIVGKHLWEAYNYESIELSEHKKVFTTGTPIESNYSAHNHKDGIPKYVSYSTYPIYKDQEIVAVYSICKNETTLKNLLSETIELKRRIRKNHAQQKKSLNNGTRFVFSDIVGISPSICKTISDAEDIALIESNLLIVGETGTGKEVFARSIHNHSKCKNEPFVAINCGAIPENLVESTLFGTVKGSYTGATNHVGLFEEAKSGTLFLDELNSLPIAMQSKLLRVLQERKVRPVGSQETLPVNCRIISAINEDPHKIIGAGKLRQDLFYRISGVYLNIEPLRKRLEDIPVLVQHFAEHYNQVLGKNIHAISKELTEILSQYTWPGNIRELEHIVENLMIRATVDDLELRIDHMPHYTKSRLLSQQPLQRIVGPSGNLTHTLRDIEERIIREQLEANRWNVSKTARDLGIVRQSLLYRMGKLNIDNPYARKFMGGE